MLNPPALECQPATTWASPVGTAVAIQSRARLRMSKLRTLVAPWQFSCSIHLVALYLARCLNVL
jgi:hypothetical protein